MDLHEDENKKFEKKKGKKRSKKCTFLPLHWFFTNDSTNDSKNKQS